MYLLIILSWNANAANRKWEFAIDFNQQRERLKRLLLLCIYNFKRINVKNRYSCRGFLMRTGFSTKDELLLYKCRFRLIPRVISHFRRKKKCEQRLQQQMTLDFVATDFSLGTQKKTECLSGKVKNGCFFNHLKGYA